MRSINLSETEEDNPGLEEDYRFEENPESREIEELEEDYKNYILMLDPLYP